jgi:ATP-dependent RNA helicase DeaD
MKFEDFNISSNLKKAINKLGFDTPTEIQAKSIPAVISGKDVLGESATGSGKTLAFGCGIFERLETGKGLQSLILTPTRELAEQVKEALKKLSTDLKVIAVYGGVAINPQFRALETANVVVATPGRFLDHLQRGTVNVSKIKFLVLDEADRMLDMGFIDDIERIISQCPKQRQTLLFSATISSRIKELSKKYMNSPVEVYVENKVDPSKLKQVYYDVPKHKKMQLMVHLLKKECVGLVMVFCNTRQATDYVAKNLYKNDVDAVAIHGGLTQNKRMNTIEKFHKSGFGVLVCTDVAARGLDISDVTYVFNYDLPKCPTDYVHRIGRTARAGKDGAVINILSRMDFDAFSAIQREHRDFKIDSYELPEMEKITLPGPKSNARPRVAKKKFWQKSTRQHH